MANRLITKHRYVFTSICFIVALGAVFSIGILEFYNPDMTRMRLMTEYWWIPIIGLVFVVLAFMVECVYLWFGSERP